jgi:hypothetical protein
MNLPRLALCPFDPHWIPPDDKRLDQFLQSIELSGKPLEQPLHFLPGDRFLDLIAFMGCSPDINLEPGDDEQPYCAIRVQNQAETVEFHFGAHTHTPRCPECRSPVDGWRDGIHRWLQGDAASLWECSVCHRRAAPWEFNWRKSAGFGRCFIEINNIFPKEALPQAHLLDTLQAYYGIKWLYFYQH